MGWGVKKLRITFCRFEFMAGEIIFDRQDSIHLQISKPIFEL